MPQICEKCIVPDTFPNVVFHEGICGFCLDYEPIQIDPKKHIVKGKDKLIELLRKNQESEYDCIVPVSGGKESTYILYYMANDLKLNPLAYTVDNGFVNEHARNNIENVCNKFGIDLVRMKTTKFRDSMIKESLYISKYMNRYWWGICGEVCRNNFRTGAIKLATEKKIPYLIWGHTADEPVPEAYGEEKLYTEFGNKKFLQLIKEYLVSYHIILYGRSVIDALKILWHKMKYDYYVVRDSVKTDAPGGYRKYFPFHEVSMKDDRVKSVFFFNYIEYEPFKFIDILRKEINWSSPENRENKMDCNLHSFQNMDFYLRTNITKDGFYYSNQVRKGIIDRDKGMLKEEATINSCTEETKRIFEHYGIPFEEMDTNFAVERERKIKKIF